MSDVEPRLDQLLQEHLKLTLDDQLSRFQAPWTPPVPMAPCHRHWKWAYAGAAVAACLVLSWLAGIAPGRWLARHPGQSTGPLASSQPAIPDRQLLEGAISWQTIDEGTVILADNTPARRLRCQVLRQVQWYDPQHQATIELAVPQEQIVYVQLPTY